MLFNGVIVIDLSCLDFINPAVKSKVIASKPRRYSRMSPEVFKLHEHVLFYCCLVLCNRIQFTVVLVDDPPRCLGVSQPVRERRQIVKFFLMKECFHRATVRMSADYDVLDTQCVHCVLDRRSFSAIRRAVWRNEISGVAENEYLSRFCLSDECRRNARIRAGDYQSFGSLTVRQLLKYLFLRTKQF